MSDKTAEQRVEEYAINTYPCLASDNDEQLQLVKRDVLAGRRDFIEHDLRKYLEMALEVTGGMLIGGTSINSGCDAEWIPGGNKYTIQEIIQLAKEGK